MNEIREIVTNSLMHLSLHGRSVRRGRTAGLLVALAGLLLGTGPLAAQTTPALAWAQRRIDIAPTYAADVVGANGIYTIISSTVGGVPAFAWSPDGLRWHDSVVSPEGASGYEYVAGGAFVDGTWVAVGSAGLVLASTDNALTWRRLPRASAGQANFNGVISTGSGLLGFGKEWKPDPLSPSGGGEVGAILLSNDGGLSWDSRNSGTTSELRTAAALDTAWIVGGKDGTLLRSTDQGLTWTPVPHLLGAVTFRHAAAGNGVFVVTGDDNGTSFAAISRDVGLTWQRVLLSSEWIEGVAFGSGMFVLSGGGSSLAGASSTDGENWQRPVRAGAWGELGFGPRGFLAVGGNYGWQTTLPDSPSVVSSGWNLEAVMTLGRPANFLLRSTARNSTFEADGLPPGLSLDPATGRLTGTPTVAGTYLAFCYALLGGAAGDVRGLVIEVRDPSSPPGEALTWTKTSNGLSAFNVSDLAAAGGVFVAVGESPAGEPLVARSADGTTWVWGVPPADTPGPGSWNLLRGVAGDGVVWLAAGRDGTLWRSGDQGFSWTNLPPIPGAQEILSLTVADGKFFAAGKATRSGEGGGEVAAIYHSADRGVTWTAATLPEAAPLLSVAEAGGVLVATGSRGTILRSADLGVTWTAPEGGGIQNLRQAAGWGARWVIVGDGGTVLVSQDGALTWSAAEAGAGPWPTGVATAEGLFLIGGGDEAAGASSRDGFQWMRPRSGAAYGRRAATANRAVALSGGEVWTARGPWRPWVLLPADGRMPGAETGGFYSWAPSITGTATRFSAAGLPRGLTINPQTGVITGTPGVFGNFNVRIAVSGPGGTGSTILPLKVTSPFLPVSGSYFGLVEPQSLLNAGLGGSMQATVTNTGVFTGRLVNGTGIFSFRGTFDSRGRAMVTIPRAGQAALQLDLTLGLTGLQANRLGGTLSDGTSTTVLATRRNVWQARTNPASQYAGYHTLGLEPAADPALPQGWGYASLTANTAGMATFSGRLADGTPWTWSAALWPDGQIPVHLALYAGRRGVLSGLANIDAMTPERPLSGDWLWVRPSGGGRIYPAGFSTRLTVQGGLYVAPAAGVRIIGLAGGNDNARFTAGGAGSTVLTVTAQNTAIIPAGGVLRSMAINPSRGLILGTVVFPNPNRTAQFLGVLLGGSLNQGRGYSLMPGTAAAPDQLSQPVQLGANP